MKIISNNECYIQKDDLDYLINNNEIIPKEVFNFTDTLYGDFIKIENESAKKYILDSSIPSFEELNSYNIKKLEHILFKIKLLVLDDYDGQKMSDEELAQVILEEKNRKYMLKQIIEMIKYKKGKPSNYYPDIPNPNMLSVTNGCLIASNSINFGNVVIYNIDGSRVENTEDVEFCNIAYKLLMHDYINDTNVDLETLYDGNYLVLKNKNLKLLKEYKKN